MSRCVARECANEGWAAEPVRGATFCFTHWDLAKASFFKDGFRLKDTRPYGEKHELRAVKVYFFTDGQYIKIGSSMDPRTRMQDFRSGRDQSEKPGDVDRENLECIGWIGGPNRLKQRALEKELHRQFAAHQAVGEWFHKSPQLVADIKALISEASTKLERAA